jgi:hypothetical protein
VPFIEIAPLRLLLAMVVVPVLTACTSLPSALQPAPPAPSAPAPVPVKAEAAPAQTAVVPQTPPVAAAVTPAPGSPSTPAADRTSAAVPAPVPVAKSATVPRTSAKAPVTVPPPKRRFVPLGPPVSARNWVEFRQQAARRLVQSNPDGTYTGAVPEPLLAIPVLEVELNADGSVRRVHVLRHPRQARDTTQMAIDAVHRAAPYGSMARLPHPWKWAEVFLFDDDRRFKPRELDK